MINIKNKESIRDRWVLDLTKIEGNKEEFNPSGVDYVLMRDCDFRQDGVEFKGVNGAFAVSDPYEVSKGEAVVISYQGLRPYENRYFIQKELEIGNLSYIDGGTNTTAVNPSRLGDPVVNYVHFPKNMNQTLHTHPSHRIGMILKGNGVIELDDGDFPIEAGDAFYMRRNELHNFTTNDEEVILFVFAPDSGTGPTDEINPLKIRTYVGQQRSIR